jgi:hypothetical protein
LEAKDYIPGLGRDFKIASDEIDTAGLKEELGIVDGGGETPTSVTAAQISDATTVGRSVLKATDAAAARTAIGAGTSSLAIGTTASTAAAGNHVHAAGTVTVTAISGVTGTDVQTVLASLGARKAATQAASTATDVAGLVTDLNALITKLKAAGLMS